MKHATRVGVLIGLISFTLVAGESEDVEPPGAGRRAVTLDLGDGVGMQLILIPSGKFVMGSSDSEKGRKRDNEGPQRRVVISKPFCMGTTEVTQEQYAAVAGKNPSKFSGPTLPVEYVSWNEAVEFCKVLSSRTRKTVRLPTEAEWEYACRAGTETRFSFGDQNKDLSSYAWWSANSDTRTHPVGGKKPNAWGLYDMHGNVWEWCGDWIVKSYAGLKETDPQGPASGVYRVLRGGSAWMDESNCRSANRVGHSVGARRSYRGIHGFRVVVESAGVDDGRFLTAVETAQCH